MAFLFAWRRLMLIALLSLAAPAAAFAQSVDQPEAPAAQGGSTLEDILRRQRGEPVDDSERRRQALDSLQAPGEGVEQLGVLGGASDADVWRAVRYGAPMSTSSPNPQAAVLVQSNGSRWLEFRSGPMARYGAYALGATVVLLLLFFLLRGRIRVSSGMSGKTVSRFNGVERFAHWLMAVSFIILGLTGLVTLYGRTLYNAAVGESYGGSAHDVFSWVTIYGKWLHNNVAWAFMLGLILSFIFWVKHNFPSRTDLVWITKGGGIIGSAHPPAKKFNAGQKVIFWGVILLGASVSASGLALLFPFELALFSKTFAALNMLGFDLPVNLTPMEEMQLASLWHAIVAFAMMVLILAHIYIGTLGMQGAFSAMGSGKVDRNWAKEHHSLWLEKVEAREASKAAGE